VEDFGDPTFATTVVTVATATIVATETTATAVVHG